VKTLRISTLCLAALLAALAPASADELLPAGKPIEEVVDHYLDAKLKEANIQAAPQADDATVIRRLTLDLVGRIPTVAETQAYVTSTDPAKRTRLVERLMASPAFVRHQANEFDVMLMEGTDRGASVRGYLTQAFTEGRSWDRIFRDLMLAEESDPKQKGAGEFLRTRIKDVDKLTAEVSAVFFGVNISCAKCHDHPKVPDWKQDHFYGMKSFFNRTFENGGFLAEREYGLVKFKTTKGAEKQAKLMFLTGKVIDSASVKEPTKDDEKKEKQQLEEYKKKKMPPPRPKYSARAQLVETSLEAGQRDFFARSIVNRVWYRHFGHGLVMPLDQMHSENPASHPELLEWLARDTIEHNYDLRRLIRGLVLSKAYARTTKWASDDVPSPRLFAVARLRALTPMQLATSLQLATADPQSFPDNMKPEEFEKRIEGMESPARGLASRIEQPREDFQIGVSEALLFSNNAQVMQEYLADRTDRLVGRLKAAKDPRAQIELAVRSTLCRPPTEEEYKVMGEYLQRRSDRPVEACQQLVWALLTSAEFRFNY
jgi:hypothetical protein